MMSYERKVLAFYYVWYGTPWGPWGGWRHWQGNDEYPYHPDLVLWKSEAAAARSVDAAHYPLDGVYDSLDPAVIARHLAQAERAGLDGFIVSWWGGGDYSDRVLDRAVELAGESPGGFEISIYYETMMVKQKNLTPRESAERIADGIGSVLERHGDDPCWLRTGGRPVVFVYVVEQFPVAVWKRVRERLAGAGHDPFLVGDTFSPEYLAAMDGLHTYNPVVRVIRDEDLLEIYSRARKAAHEEGALFAGTVLPGYDDRKIRTPGLHCPREGGGLYRATWRASLEAGSDWILITSWNEWHEGSDIESSREYGDDYLYLTRQLAEAFRG